MSCVGLSSCVSEVTHDLSPDLGPAQHDFIISKPALLCPAHSQPSPGWLTRPQRHLWPPPPTSRGGSAGSAGCSWRRSPLLVYVGKDSRQKGLIAVPSFAGILMAANHPCLAEIPQNSVEEQLWRVDTLLSGKLAKTVQIISADMWPAVVQPAAYLLADSTPRSGKFQEFTISNLRWRTRGEGRCCLGKEGQIVK